MRQPHVLVLDEATSALDMQTEREVQMALEAAAQGRCTLSIAHRLSTIAACDEIIVLVAGCAVERGRHESLLQNSSGLYASMWAKQLEGHTEAHAAAASTALAPTDAAAPHHAIASTRG